MMKFNSKKFFASSLKAIHSDVEFEECLEYMENSGWKLVDITHYEDIHQTLLVTHKSC